MEDGLTQPVFSYEEAITETLWVEAPMDSDFDGRNDRIRIDVIRPAATEHGLDVPVIMEASPYYDPGPTPKTPRGFPGWWDEYFVPRGYAIVQVEMQGTSRSEGCPSIGGTADTTSVEAVIDWLNGRAPGYHLDGTPAEAYWTNGKVGMHGLSYVGTLPNAAAVEGIRGLRTVVPISAISNWYRYPRAQGIRRAVWGQRYPQWLAHYVMSPRAERLCSEWIAGWPVADDTGDFTQWWQQRNYIPRSQKIKTTKTSVFIVHGYNDLNVKIRHGAALWYEVAQRNMPRKIWIHRGGHVNPMSFRPDKWQQVMHRWMDRWLYGIENGIMDEPRVSIQRPDGTWKTYARWPAAGTKDVGLRLGPASDKAPGTLSLDQTGGAPTQTFVDNWTRNYESDIIADPKQAKPHRLVYLTPPLEEDVRISGTPHMNVRFSTSATSIPLTALLIDYGRGKTITSVEDKTPIELITESCSPANIANRTGCAEPMEVTSSITPHRVITRGSVDGKNNVNLRRSAPLEPGKAYNISWELQPRDYIVPAGHRIGVVVVGNYQATHPYWQVVRDSKAEGEKITIHLNNSRLILPVVGGKKALQEALGS